MHSHTRSSSLARATDRDGCPHAQLRTTWLSTCAREGVLSKGIGPRRSTPNFDQSWPKRGAGIRSPTDHTASNSLVGKSVVAECLTNKTGFRKWSPHHKSVTTTKDESLKTLLKWAETPEVNACAR